MGIHLKVGREGEQIPLPVFSVLGVNFLYFLTKLSRYYNIYTIIY